MSDCEGGDDGEEQEVHEPPQHPRGHVFQPFQGRFRARCFRAGHLVERRADEDGQDGGADELPADGPVPPEGAALAHTHLVEVLHEPVGPVHPGHDNALK